MDLFTVRSGVEWPRLSLAVVQRPKQRAGLVAPRIDDWRAMVDSVMIGVAYDGQVFNVVLAGVPDRKNDLAVPGGECDLPAPIRPCRRA